MAKRIKQRGFTLIEMITVMTIISILSAAVWVFVRLPMNNYVESIRHAEYTDTEDTVFRWLERDLQLALPNSVRVRTDQYGNFYLEFLMTRDGGRYNTDDWDSQPIASSHCNKQLSCDVRVVSDNGVKASLNDFVVVYNLSSPGFNAYENNLTADPGGLYPRNRFKIRALLEPVPGTTDRYKKLQLESLYKTYDVGVGAFKDEGIQSDTVNSPINRFHIVMYPVTYKIDFKRHEVRRFWNYKIQPTQPASPSFDFYDAVNYNDNQVHSARVATDVYDINGTSSNGSFRHFRMIDNRTEMLSVRLYFQKNSYILHNNQQLTVYREFFLPVNP